MSVDGSKHTQAPVQRHAAPPMVNAPPQNVSSRNLLSPRLAIWTSKLSDGSINSFCGAMAGAASGIVTCPLDVIKTKLQAQGGFIPKDRIPVGDYRPQYRGMVPTAQLIWRQDGLRGMYRGLGPMLLGYLPTWAVYMGVYGQSRDYFYTQIGKSVVSRDESDQD